MFRWQQKICLFVSSNFVYTKFAMVRTLQRVSDGNAETGIQEQEHLEDEYRNKETHEPASSAEAPQWTSASNGGRAVAKAAGPAGRFGPESVLSTREGGLHEPTGSSGSISLHGGGQIGARG